AATTSYFNSASVGFAIRIKYRPVLGSAAGLKGELGLGESRVKNEKKEKKTSSGEGATNTYLRSVKADRNQESRIREVSRVLQPKHGSLGTSIGVGGVER
ncbi:hypothetical protein B296_00010365, partial [Ensete ventricosum]